MMLTAENLSRIPGYGDVAELAGIRADDQTGRWLFLPIPGRDREPPDGWMVRAGLRCVVGVLAYPEPQEGLKVADRLTIWGPDRAEAIRCPDDAVGVGSPRDSRFCYWYRRGGLADVVPVLARLTPPGLTGAPTLRLPLPRDLWTP